MIDNWCSTADCKQSAGAKVQKNRGSLFITESYRLMIWDCTPGDSGETPKYENNLLKWHIRKDHTDNFFVLITLLLTVFTLLSFLL